MVRRTCAWLIAAVLLAAAPAAQGELVITRKGTPLYHRPGCPTIKDGKDVLLMPRGQAEAKGLKPHRECDPSYVPPKPAPAAVWVDDAGRFYHREKCPRLGKSPKKITVDQAAARKLYPCRTCKPPIRPRPSK